MQDYLHYGWISAKHLKSGEHLKTSDGTTVTVVKGTTPKQHDGWMWDLTVPGNGDHDFYVFPSLASNGRNTYYVEAGSVLVLVHNCPPVSGEPSTPNIIKNAVKDGTYTARLNPDGTPDIFTARSGTPLAIARKWGGAQIYDVPGGDNSYRILINQYGDIGWISGHNYNRINVYVPPTP